MRKLGVFLKNIIVISIISCIICVSTCATPSLSAKSAILINADTCEILFEHNADIKSGMASTTKIMTAILAIESGKLDETFKIPKAAIGVEGSSLYLKDSESITLRDLVIGLMLRSANDAAEAIAIILSNSVEAFSQSMNEKAQTLGLTNTHFENPHGLASGNHYTTAKELAFLTAYAVKNATFREICSMNDAKISTNETHRIVLNHNKLLKIYDGAYGVKTGYTRTTGRCLVSAAKRNGINLIAVTLNAPNDWNDHRNLLDYGFENYEVINLAQRGQVVTSITLIGGTKSSVPVYVKNELSICLSKKRNSVVEKIELNPIRFAPIYQGDTVGNIKYFIDGKEIASSPLCAAEYVGSNPKRNSLLKKLYQLGTLWKK